MGQKNITIDPLVSIIIPTYNLKEYVQQAIDSVLAQTHTDYEIIVVDDGSSNGTGEALAARLGRAGRRRIEERFSMERSIGNLWRIIELTIEENK